MTVPEDIDRLRLRIYRLAGWTGTLFRTGGPAKSKDGEISPIRAIELHHAHRGSDWSLCSIRCEAPDDDGALDALARQGLRRKLHGRRFAVGSLGGDVDSYMDEVAERVATLPASRRQFDVDDRPIMFDVVRHRGAFAAAARVEQATVVVSAVIPEDDVALTRVPVDTFTELQEYIANWQLSD